MPTGIFTIYPIGVPTAGGSGLFDVGVNAAGVATWRLDAVDGISGPGASANVSINFNEGKLWLDGSNVGSALGDLPVGFQITSATLNGYCQITTTSGFTADPNYHVTFSNISLSGIPGVTGTSASGSAPGISVQIPIDGPYSTLNYIGLNTLSFDMTNTSLDADVSRMDIHFQENNPTGSFTPPPTGLPPFFTQWVIKGTYTTTSYQWYYELIEEEYEDIDFTRPELTRVEEGDTPPDGAIPLGGENEEPVFFWWEYDDGDIILYLYSPISPGIGWTIVAAPTNYGWWKSFEEFLGGALLIVNGNPKKPRTFDEITDYSSYFGGFPGCGTVYNYKLVYAGRDYDDEPVMRIFDGLSDRELCRVPPVSGVDATAIISVATVNGTIYITTLDSGTTDTTYTGRVFELDVPSASLTQIGGQFTGGEVPYAVAWHNGMLWCGTNPAGDGGESGKIYKFRPDVDTVWEEDFDLSTPVEAQVGAGCTGLVSYKGGLVVTCSAAAGQRAPLYIRGIGASLVPSPDTYVWWGEGPDDNAGNFWGSPIVFNDVLYVTYWDSTYGASIWSWEGALFTERVPPQAFSDGKAVIGLYSGAGNLYGVYGGFDRSVELVGTEDGVSWDYLTQFLPGYETERATPIFAEVRTA